MEGLLNTITGLGIFAVLLVIFAESGLLIGFFLPGDSLLFTAGFLVQQDIGSFGKINIFIFVLLLAIAAIVGDSTGYAFGRKVGRKLFERENSRFFKKKHLEEAERFFEKHGAISIVLARFVPIVRTFTPVVAGAGKMHYKTFVSYNVIGGVLWTTAFTLLGYFAGDILKKMNINIELAAIIIVLISIMPIIIPILKDKKRRNHIINSVKYQFRVILRKDKKAD